MCVLAADPGELGESAGQCARETAGSVGPHDARPTTALLQEPEHSAPEAAATDAQTAASAQTTTPAAATTAAAAG